MPTQARPRAGAGQTAARRPHAGPAGGVALRALHVRQHSDQKSVPAHGPRRGRGAAPGFELAAASTRKPGALDAGRAALGSETLYPPHARGRIL